jgi:hypothetical protein
MATIGGGDPYVVTQRPATVIGVSASPTTTSTTDVDLPDMAVALTTTGGDLLCFGACVVGNSTSATGNVYITLYLDGTQKGMASLATPGIGNWDTVMVHDMLEGVASGAHTVKLRWHTDGGTAVANGIQRALTVIEFRR